jgi:hypothetical protein
MISHFQHLEEEQGEPFEPGLVCVEPVNVLRPPSLWALENPEGWTPKRHNLRNRKINQKASLAVRLLIY